MPFRIRELMILVCCLGASTIAFAGPDYDAIADNLVNGSLEVQPGEIIQISGTPDQIALMGALQVAVRKAGGEPMLTLQLPEANKRALLETPMEHLKRVPTSPVMLTRMIDGFINVASVEDPDLFADIPEERLAATRKAGAQLNHVFRNASFRSVSLGQTGGIPTESYANTIAADYGDLDKMFWSALAVAPEQIHEAAVLVNGMLRPGIDVHVSSKAGTDLRFRIADMAPRINAGRAADVEGHGPKQVWLPAGEAYTAVEPGSARGKLVVEHAMFRGEEIKNLEMHFRDGKVTEIKGEKTNSLKKFLAASDEDTSLLSVFDIGLNPHSKTPQGSKYMSWEMGGMVTLGLGNNLWAGGDNASDGAFSVHVPAATVEAGGATLTSNGELPGQVLAVYRTR